MDILEIEKAKFSDVKRLTDGCVMERANWLLNTMRAMTVRELAKDGLLVQVTNGKSNLADKVSDAGA